MKDEARPEAKDKKEENSEQMSEEQLSLIKGSLLTIFLPERTKSKLKKKAKELKISSGDLAEGLLRKWIAWDKLFDDLVMTLEEALKLIETTEFQAKEIRKTLRRLRRHAETIEKRKQQLDVFKKEE